MAEKKVSRGYAASVVSCRCPRCREGKLFQHPVTVNFKKNMLMNKECTVCGQASEIEVGFYYAPAMLAMFLLLA